MDKRLFFIRVIWGIAGSLTAVIIMFLFTFNWMPPLYDDCIETTAILNNQKVSELKNHCDNCLIFNVTEYFCKDNYTDICDSKDRLLFFANEKEERNDLKEGSKILINWCFIKEIEEYRIRGIKDGSD